jgi:hypothetical protein
MNGLNKGALAMVLAGSVTFAVSNVLVVEQAFQRLSDANPLSITGDLIKENGISQGEKTKKDETPKADKKEDRTNLTSQEAIKNNRVANQQDANTSNKSTTTTTTPAVTKKAATTKKATPPKATATTTPSKPSTTSPATKPTENTTNSKVHKTTTTPAPSGNTTSSTKKTPTTPVPSGNTTSSTKTTTNHGQQVSQDAKEKAPSQRDQKENNGKKK